MFQKVNLFNPILLIFTFAFNLGMSQSKTTISDDIKFEEDTSEEVVEIEIEEGISILNFSFYSKIGSGKVNVIIMDPNGKKEGGLELEAAIDKRKTKNSIKNSNSNSNSNTNSSSSSSSSTVSATQSSTRVSVSGSGKNTDVNVNDNGNSASVYSYSNTNGGNANGNMSKSVTNPLSGKWKVIISTEKVTGLVRYSINKAGN